MRVNIIFDENNIWRLMNILMIFRSFLPETSILNTTVSPVVTTLSAILRRNLMFEVEYEE